MRPAPPPDPGDQAATVVRTKPARHGVPAGAFSLVVTEGPDRGQVFRIDGSHPSRVLLGQSPACAVRLTDPEISRRHAAFEITATGLRVLDLESTNGTYVDRLRIHDAELEGDGLLRVGSTTFRVERVVADAPPPPPATSFGRLIGASLEMRRLYPLCARLAASDVPVIIEGETGTGKEVLAEGLHEQGARHAGPFAVFDCTALPANLVESELFGHERGAFTGAVGQRHGIFEQAHGGTLFIDEIGDLELSLQPKLLRALERFEVRRVGGDRWIRVDVRVVAATRRDLDREVAAGRFRDDLFHRLAVGRVELPPLRDRHGDVRLLAEHFSRELGGLEQSLPGDLVARWEDCAWPGNVRELRNAVARHIALGDLVTARAGQASGPSSAVGPSDLLEGALARGLPFIEARDRLVEEFEQQYIARVLQAHGNDVARAAAASGIGRRYFQKLLARHR